MWNGPENPLSTSTQRVERLHFLLTASMYVAGNLDHSSHPESVEHWLFVYFAFPHSFK